MHTARVVRWIVFLAASGIAISKLLRADTDFGIYLQAARELSNPELDIYRSHEEHGAYPYPHWVVLPLVPFAHLPEVPVRVLYGLLQGLATVWIVTDVHKLVSSRVLVRPWHWVVFVLLFARWLSSNYTNGQLSLWVAAFTIRGIAELDAGRRVHAGVMIGVAAAAKLTPLAFLAALPFMGFASSALWMVGTVIALVFVVPWPFLGTAEHVRHLVDFYHAMIAPLFGGGGARGDAAIWTGANGSIQGTLRTLLQAPAEPGTIRTHWCELSDAALRNVQRVYSVAVFALLAVAFFVAKRRPERLIAQASVVTIAMALFSPLTRTYHCALLALAGMWFVAEPKTTRWRRVAWGLIAAAFAFSMMLRQKGLLGRDLWHALDRCGLMHFGIVGMLGMLAVRPPDAATRQP